VYAPEISDAPARCTLRDLQGRVLQSREILLAQGYNRLFDNLQLPPGVYALSVEAGAGAWVWKVWGGQ
jgi:hypothetical protein